MSFKNSKPFQELKEQLDGHIDSIKEQISFLKKELLRKEKDLAQKESYRSKITRIEAEGDSTNPAANEQDHKNHIEDFNENKDPKREPPYDIVKRRKKVEEIMAHHGGKNVHLNIIAQEIQMPKGSLGPWMVRLSSDPNSGIKKEPNVSAFTLTKSHQQSFLHR